VNPTLIRWRIQVCCDDRTLWWCSYYGRNVHYNVKKRPHVDTFLAATSRLGFEVVLFTASEPLVTLPVVSHLDPHSTIFQHVLCRSACTPVPGAFLKVPTATVYLMVVLSLVLKVPSALVLNGST
jgi:NLI interacting factor-like phosphatase